MDTSKWGKLKRTIIGIMNSHMKDIRDDSVSLASKRVSVTCRAQCEQVLRAMKVLEAKDDKVSVRSS